MAILEENIADPKAEITTKDSWFGIYISVLNTVGTLWIFVLLIIINFDIAGRTLFNKPLQGVNEIVSVSIVACVFMQLAHTLKVGRLTRSDIFLNWLGKFFPNTGHLLETFYNFIGAGLMVILFTASWPLFINAWKIKEFAGNQGVFTILLWPVKLMILIGCANATIQFLIFCVTSFKKLKPFKHSRKTL